MGRAGYLEKLINYFAQGKEYFKKLKLKFWGKFSSIV
jgi:hypothetical protein